MTADGTVVLSVPELDDDVDALSAALAYAKAGWYVGPVKHAGKNPGALLGRSWHTRTSRDPETLVDWFAGTDHGVFLHAGRSGAVIFDIDHPDQLPEVLASAIKTTGPPAQATRRGDTRRGHALFRQPAGRSIGNGSGSLGKAFGEVRGTNGVIVVAPSVHEKHADGGLYAWQRTGPVPDLPAELAAALPDATQAADAAGTAEVAAFLDQYVAQGRPMLLRPVLAKLDQQIADRASRHDSARDALCQSMREAQAGCYPARDAVAGIRRRFEDAVAGERRDPAEWTGLVAWAVAQARLDDPAARRADIDARTSPSLGEPPAGDEPPDEVPDFGPDPWAGIPTVGEQAAAGREADGDPLGAATDGAAETDTPSRLVDGGSFIHDAPDTVPALWGRDDDVLWSAGEPCLIVGPTGVGKTTLGGQVVAGRLGLLDQVLGFPVIRGRRVLYLAMDRPEQIRRALGRVLKAFSRELLAERLTVWKGPPAADLAKHPTTLLALAHEADADTVVLDSLKDAAIKLVDDEVGQGLNRAMQLCVANGVEVLGFHHQRKRGKEEGKKPGSIDDVYGSTWITAGAGSVLSLWGAGGDEVVELSHLKQPAAPVGPLTLSHDHQAGTSTVLDAHDPLDLLRAGPRSASEVAAAVSGTETPSKAEVQKARRRLDRLVSDGRAIKLDAVVRGGSSSGSIGSRYALAARRPEAPMHAAEPTHEPMHAPDFDHSTHADARRRTSGRVSAGQATHEATHATHAAATHETVPPFRGDGSRAPGVDEPVLGVCERCSGQTSRPRDDSGELRCGRCAYPGGGDPEQESDDD